MTQQARLVLLGGVLVSLISSAFGHGYLVQPPSRSTAWRYGYSTPPNYNDMELYCGGFAVSLIAVLFCVFIRLSFAL